MLHQTTVSITRAKQGRLPSAGLQVCLHVLYKQYALAARRLRRFALQLWTSRQRSADQRPNAADVGKVQEIVARASATKSARGASTVLGYTDKPWLDCI